MQEQIERDIKSALLSGDKVKTETLKNIKNSLQYEAVAKGVKPNELSDEQAQAVLAREAKKRQEAADLYESANETERQQKELAEKSLIAAYLPEQMSEEEVKAIVAEEVAKLSSPGAAQMGQIIGSVRARTMGQADGGLIARLTKEELKLL
jgi:uncharacterized protein